MTRYQLILKILLLGIVVAFNPLTAQKHTLSGHVREAGSGEALIGATVFDTLTKTGALTNAYGFFSLSLPEGEHQIIVSYVGYDRLSQSVSLKGDQTVQFDMEPEMELETVEITAEDNEQIHQINRMSSHKISMEKVKSLPVLLGERDVLKTIQLLPGIQSGSEGSSGLYVRGGGADQNLILMDGVPIYNASHLFGFVSVFNGDAINYAEIVKGGFPARYGGRLSSVLDIRMKEGNMERFKGEASIGIVSGKFTLEGPIIKDKTSFIVSGRRTWIDLLSLPIQARINQKREDKITTRYHFYDLNAKINHKFSDNSRLFLSGYMGDDKFSFVDKSTYTDGTNVEKPLWRDGLKWGNKMGAVRWNKIFSPKLFSNTTLTYTNYKFDLSSYYLSDREEKDKSKVEEYEFKSFSNIEDWGGKIDFDFFPNSNHSIRFGTGYTYHTYKPTVFQEKSKEGNTTSSAQVGSPAVFAHEAQVYIEDDMRIGSRLAINPGLHASAFMVKDKIYHSLQPRFSARLLLDEKSSIKASYSKMTQFVHLLTTPSIGLPSDLWVPSTEKIKPEHSHQVALGYARTLPKGFQFSAEAYYKTMENLLEYEEGADFFSSGINWEDNVEVGRGWSYGGEVLLEKKTGKTTGWIGYTLSWTERQFDNLNFGQKFPYRYDRRHDLGMAVTHKFNDRVDVGMVYVYGTGNAVTLGLERYLPLPGPGDGFGAQPITHIQSRNNYRMPSYHRLDLAVNLHKEIKWGERTWSFGLYNSYNRRNPFMLLLREDPFTGATKLKQLSILPILPYATYSIKF